MGLIEVLGACVKQGFCNSTGRKCEAECSRLADLELSGEEGNQASTRMCQIKDHSLEEKEAKA